MPLSAHLELHIEQGRRLELADKTIGVVDSIQGVHWFRIYVDGIRAHAGSTPIAQRGDAVVAASKIIVYLEELAIKNDAFATVGTLNLTEASPNVVSGGANFTIDLRHPSEAVLLEIEAALETRMAEISKDKENRVTFETRKIWHSPARDFDVNVADCIRKSAVDLVGAPNVMQSMRSFAGHDSALIATAGTPTAMMFVPSLEGVSHAPAEWTSKEDW